MISGPEIAFESAGHREITSDSANASLLSQMRPPEIPYLRMVMIFSELPEDVVETDWTIEQFSDTPLGHRFLSQDGQATHFMANQGQSQRDAYVTGLKKIFGPADHAVQCFREYRGKGVILTNSNHKVAVSLGDAVHALQDSFSPAHVERRKVGNKWVICRIFVWGDQDKAVHKAGDRSWKLTSGDGIARNPELSEIGKACREATDLLLRYFVLKSVYKEREAEQQKRLVMERFLSFAGGV